MVLVLSGVGVPLLGWVAGLEAGGIAVMALLGLSLVSLAWSFWLVPRWLSPTTCRVWTVFGWRTHRVPAGADVEVGSQGGPHFYGEVASIFVDSRLRRRRIRLRCTLSSNPREAACARLDVECDRQAVPVDRTPG